MPWHESIIESELAKTKVLVNATSIGLTDDATPIPAEIIPPELLVLDLIYKRTRLLRDAEAAGCTVADGELMLLHQGAAAFTLWTGQPAPLELMQRKLQEARAGGAALGRGRAGRRRGRSRTPARERHGRDRRLDASGNRPATPRQASRPGPPRRTDGRHPVGRLRFLTAGESHGPTLGVTIEGVPAGLPLSADALAVDLARRQRGYGRGARQAIEHDRAEIVAGVRHGLTLGSPILLLVANRDWENWTRVMQVEALADDEAAELAAARRGRQQAGDAGHPRPARPRRPRRRAQVRLQRRPQRARAGVGAGDRGAGRRRRRRPARSSRELGVEVWSFTAEVGGVARRSGARDALARGGRRVAAALPGSRRRGGDDRPDRRGAVERRHRRRRVRGRRPRPADRARARTSTGIAGSTPRSPPRS